MRQYRRFVRAAVSLGAALLIAGAAAAVPATPAFALPSGDGWAASWNYYTDTSIQFEATVPSARVVGFTSDDNGRRTTGATVVDTGNSFKCANLQIFVGGVGFVANQTICGTNNQATVTTGTYTGAIVVILTAQSVLSSSNDRVVSIIIPSSADEPELHSTGTGTSWRFTSATQAVFSAQRPGVRLEGKIDYEGGDYRLVTGFTSNLGPEGCAAGMAVINDENRTGYTSCVPPEHVGEHRGWGKLFDVLGDFQVDACRLGGAGPDKCLGMTIPTPS